LQAIKFAQQIGAKKQIAHGWLLKGPHGDWTELRAPVHPSVAGHWQTNRNTQRENRDCIDET